MVSRNFNIVWQKPVSNNGEDQPSSDNVDNNIHQRRIDKLKCILKQSCDLQDKVIVVKLPSCVIENEELLAGFAENVQLFSLLGVKIFIVHGYVNLISSTLKGLGMDDISLQDIKVTDRRNAQIIEMVVSGHINKKIVSSLSAAGCNAIGLSGKDANLIQVEKARFLRKYNMGSDSGVINVGFVGEPEIVNAEILLNFEENGVIPVISPISHDNNGRTHLLEINMTASLIAEAIDADHLILLSEYELLGNRELKFDDEISVQNLLHSVGPESRFSYILKAILWATRNSTRLVHFSTVTGKDSLLTTLFDVQK